MIIDSHCHLEDEKFNNEIEDVIQRAIDNDVVKMVVVGSSIETSIKILELTKSYDFLYPTVGIHPEEANNFHDGDLEIIENLIKNNKVYAIGEIGLDYYWVKDNKEIQKALFRSQIELAIKYHLPIIIHSRDAICDTLDILKEYKGKVVGVMHSFSGSVEMAREFLKLGYYLSISGPVTYKNAKNIIEVVKEVDLNRLLVETDSPYLPPTPYRGMRNEPSYVVEVVKKIAEIKEIDVEIVKNNTSQNAINLFHLSNDK